MNGRNFAKFRKSQYGGLWYISHYFTIVNLLATSYLNNNCIKGIKHTAHWRNISKAVVVKSEVGKL